MFLTLTHTRVDLIGVTVLTDPQLSQQLSGACSITFFLHNLRQNGRKLQNFGNLRANLQSKFGRNYKSVIYGSIKFYGTGPSTQMYI